MDSNNHSTNIYLSLRNDFTARVEERLTEWRTFHFFPMGVMGKPK